MTQKTTRFAKLRNKIPVVGKIIVAVILLAAVIPTMGSVWVKDSRQSPEYCASCQAEPYYDSWAKDSDALAHKHADLSISCQTCHDRTLTESLKEMVTYAQGDYKFPLKERKLSKQECFKCHGSYNEIRPLTDPATTTLERNPHDSHKGDLECGICHNMHRPSVDACSECHDPMIEQSGWVTFDEQ